MKWFSKRDVHVGVIVILTTTALVAIILRPGIVTHVVDPHDGGMRVTNGRMAMVAHLSYHLQTPNRDLCTPSTSFDADQSSSQVVMSDASSDTYTQIDDITLLRVADSDSTVPALVSRRFRP